MSSIIGLGRVDQRVHGCRLSFQRVCKLTALGSVYASVMGLTACATSAELESLRSEVAKANATAVNAEAEVSRIQRELIELKAVATSSPSSDALSEPVTRPAAPSSKPSGYKWGAVSRY
jgi:hypothetical protein